MGVERTASTATRWYREGRLEEEGFPLEEVSAKVAEPGGVVWVGTTYDQADALESLGRELGLHELALEDLRESFQRPKFDVFPDHALLVCHLVRPTHLIPPTLATTEVDALLGSNWLVTVTKGGEFDYRELCSRWDRAVELTRFGAAYLLYGLVDLVVDRYLDTLDVLEQYYDGATSAIFEGEPIDPERQRDWFEARRSLMRLHRLVLPSREAVSALMRHEYSLIRQDLYPYFQDVYDHLLRAGDSIEALRDLVVSLVETNLALRDYRQNQVVKKVGSWAAILAVPTLVTGYYGMNVPYPGSGQMSGVIASAALMVAASAVLYRVFKSRDWL